VVVTLALAAALCFAGASVLQQQAAAAAPADRSMRLGLLTHLVQRPRWLCGIIVDIVGYTFQVLALDQGPLALVQPLLAAGLLFALVFNASPGQRGLRKRDWGAALVTAAGLAVFVIVGAPKGDPSTTTAAGWAAFAAVSAAGVTVALIMARRRRAGARAALLALGAGVAFGLSAALTKQSVEEFHLGAVHMLTTGYPYALAVAGAGGMLLTQSAFQAGSLAASLPTLTLSEPVFASVAGAILFGEHLRPGGRGVTGVVAALIAAGAVVFLTRSPRAQPVIAAS
jgi:drug/metabolite transporter (DMT)-like permease